jgi:hypothetical protein
MKPFLLLILTLVLWQNAYAASFVGVNGLAEERLMRVAEIHKGLDHLYNECGSRGFLQIAARRLNEKWENTVRQAVYFTNTGVNAPASGVRAKLVDLKTVPGMESFVENAFSANVRELSREDARRVGSFKAILGTFRGDFMFFVGEHENSLGPASYAVVVDLVNAEVLVLQPNRCH